jgi:hypothetical protein
VNDGVNMTRLLFPLILLPLLCQCTAHRSSPKSWETSLCMPDTYKLVEIYETHGREIFKGDRKRAEEYRRMVAEGFWGYFANVLELDGIEEALRVLRFCVQKHGLNSALITPVPRRKRPADVDAEVDRLLMGKTKKTFFLLRITSEPCDLKRVELFRKGARL